jgi:hypothetical protein|eukprot:COSAG01_NODE_1621_length_9711_cov_55.630292_4_plen_178_part_00
MRRPPASPPGRRAAAAAGRVGRRGHPVRQSWICVDQTYMHFHPFFRTDWVLHCELLQRRCSSSQAVHCLTAPPARTSGHKCCPRNPRGRGNQRSHAGRADGSQADAAAWAAARATQQLRAACSHPACVASPVHAHESQTDSLLAGARRYMPHRCACTRATSTLLRRLRCAWRIRSRL